MGMMAGSGVATRDERSATEKASSVLGQVNNLYARINDLNGRLGMADDLKSATFAERGIATAAPAPMPLLHESLDMASRIIGNINDALDRLGQRL